MHALGFACVRNSFESAVCASNPVSIKNIKKHKIPTLNDFDPRRNYTSRVSPFVVVNIGIGTIQRSVSSKMS